MEILFDFDPDGGSGAAEWVTVAGLAVATALCAVAGNRTWHNVDFG